MIQPLLDLCKSQHAERAASKHGRVGTPYTVRICSSHNRSCANRSKIQASSLLVLSVRRKLFLSWLD